MPGRRRLSYKIIWKGTRGVQDIVPQKRPLNAQSQPSAPSSRPPDTTELPVEAMTPPDIPEVPRPNKKRRIWVWIILCVLGLIALAIGGVIIWYQTSLRPVDAASAARHRVAIAEGSSPSQIGTLLEENKLIRSSFAFDIYTRLSNTRSKLQAGVYALSPSQSTQAMVADIVSGKVDDFSLTFLPGATEEENKAALVKSGYSSKEVGAAFNKSYDHPLFASKPASAGIEGYIYGETYQFSSDATVEQVLSRAFDEYYRIIQENNLVAAFKKQGLTLYEGITLASIIQREVPNATDQKRVAQIFLKRYRSGMMLGSDITAYYGADKEGLRRSVATDTPYNTRIHEGLPPGPIATPGLTALEAAAHPAAGDYLYFLSGDDEVTYYARTEEEHQANIVNHCQVKCAVE